VMLVVSGTTCAKEKKELNAISRQAKPKRIMSCILMSDITLKFTNCSTAYYNFEQEVTKHPR
jgi:hypothetical protein